MGRQAGDLAAAERALRDALELDPEDEDILEASRSQLPVLEVMS